MIGSQPVMWVNVEVVARRAATTQSRPCRPGTCPRAGLCQVPEHADLRLGLGGAGQLVHLRRDPLHLAGLHSTRESGRGRPGQGVPGLGRGTGSQLRRPLGLGPYPGRLRSGSVICHNRPTSSGQHGRAPSRLGELHRPGRARCWNPARAATGRTQLVDGHKTSRFAGPKNCCPSAGSFVGDAAHVDYLDDEDTDRVRR